MKVEDAQREAEIRALDLLGLPVPDVLHRLTAMAARLTGASYAEINIISANSQHTIVSTTGERATVPAGASFCARIVQESAPTHLVPDARLDERFAEHGATLSGQVASYAASQLITSTGVRVGTLCVYDAQAHVLDETSSAVLSELSAAVVDVVEARRQHQDLRSWVARLTDGSRELRRSNRHLAAFAGQVAHDVQGPLSSVLMALQMMEEDQGRDDPLLGAALSGAQRMRVMIAGLMDFAVLGGSLSPTLVDMNEAVADVLADLSTRIGSADVTVAELPTVWGDEVQVRSVTQNLVANALKYAGPSPVIEIVGQTFDDRTRVTVHDDGPGVPLSQREAIFGMQVRGEGVELMGVDGLGIGLATCRRILEAHGGGIGVGDSPRGGAAFWFELPNRAAEISVAV